MSSDKNEKKKSRAHYKTLTSGNVFGTLRILVIGRTDAGKSTLINLMLGLTDKQGPGYKNKKLDINKEWSHPTLPLKIHEDDVVVPVKDPDAPKKSLLKRVIEHARDGQPDITELKKFLKSRQNRSDFSERVHMVWFVMSATDEQNASNAKALAVLGDYDALPVLLVVTKGDLDADGSQYAKNVEAHLGELLKDVKTKDDVMANIVRLSNDVKNRKVDDDALSALSEKTQMHLDSEELKAAWAAAQVVDFQEKIKASAREIVAYKEAAIWASPAGLIPGPHQTIVGSLLTGLCRSLCILWGVPKPFKKSLKSNLASQEVYNKQFSLLLTKFADMGKGAVGMGPFAGLATRAATPVASKVVSTAVVTSISDTLAVSITPVAVAAASIGWVYASRNDAYNSMVAMTSLGLMVSGAILYVKATYDPKGWNVDRKKSQYDEYIEEFVTKHGPDLKKSIEEHHTIKDVFNPEKDRESVIQDLVEYFDRISAEHGDGQKLTAHQ